MNSETLVTSSGVIRNRSKPRVGIVSANSLYNELFEDCINNGIDLTWESFRDELAHEIDRNNPDLGADEKDELFEKESECAEFDSHTFLLGAWVKVNDRYEIDKSGKSGSYALVYDTGSNNVSVEWSTLTTQCNNTSPCYVMSDGSGPCGDLDSKGDAVTAYTLPANMFSDERDT